MVFIIHLITEFSSVYFQTSVSMSSLAICKTSYAAGPHHLKTWSSKMRWPPCSYFLSSIIQRHFLCNSLLHNSELHMYIIFIQLPYGWHSPTFPYLQICQKIAWGQSWERGATFHHGSACCMVHKVKMITIFLFHLMKSFQFVDWRSCPEN